MSLLSSAVTLGFVLTTSAFPQARLSVSSASVQAGGTAVLDLSISSGNTAAAVQWTLTGLDSGSSLQIAPGPSATGANKSLLCNRNTCVVAGAGGNTISDGVLAKVTVTTLATASAGDRSIQPASVMFASADGMEISSTGSPGVLSILQTAGQPNLITASAASAAVRGGDSIVFNVGVDGPAPAGGSSIALWSTDPTVAPVPSSVVIPAGSSTASFTVSTKPVSTVSLVTIVVTAGDRRIQVGLRVNPGGGASTYITSVSTPTTILQGATTFPVYINLSAPAPPGGYAISISSMYPVVTTPAVFTIPADSQTGVVALATNPTTAGVTTAIEFTAGGRTSTIYVTVAP